MLIFPNLQDNILIIRGSKFKQSFLLPEIRGRQQHNFETFPNIRLPLLGITKFGYSNDFLTNVNIL